MYRPTVSSIKYILTYSVGIKSKITSKSRVAVNAMLSANEVWSLLDAFYPCTFLLLVVNYF